MKDKDKTKLDLPEIISIANFLKEKSEKIYNEYKTNCTPAMELSKECLALSGLNTDECFQTLDEIYRKLHERLLGFSDFLINDIVGGYTALSESLVKNTEKNIQ